MYNGTCFFYVRLDMFELDKFFSAETTQNERKNRALTALLLIVSFCEKYFNIH